MYGQDLCDHVTFLVKSSLEDWPIIYKRDRPILPSKLTSCRKYPFSSEPNEF